MSGHLPDLRPTSAAAPAATMETGAEHQPQELVLRGSITINGHTSTGTLTITPLAPAAEKASGLGDLHFTMPHVEGVEQLAKVLPAGGPLLGGRCRTCLYTPEQARQEPFHGCPDCDGGPIA